MEGIEIEIELMGLALVPSHYEIRNSPGGETGSHVFSNWVLEASRDGLNWYCLSVHQGEGSMKGAVEPARVRGWTITPGEEGEVPYSKFRIVQTGDSYHVNPEERGTNLGCSGIELYGVVMSIEHPWYTELLERRPPPIAPRRESPGREHQPYHMHSPETQVGQVSSPHVDPIPHKLISRGGRKVTSASRPRKAQGIELVTMTKPGGVERAVREQSTTRRTAKSGIPIGHPAGPGEAPRREKGTKKGSVKVPKRNRDCERALGYR